jgi:hypothetical protein
VVAWEDLLLSSTFFKLQASSFKTQSQPEHDIPLDEAGLPDHTTPVEVDERVIEVWYIGFYRDL